MIIDAQNTFCRNLDVTDLAATPMYTNAIDVGGGDAVNQMYLVCHIPAALQDGTILLTLETADKEDFTDVKDLITAHTTKAVGYPFKCRLPLGCKKYIRLRLESMLDASKTKLGAGKFSAYLVYDTELGGW